MKRLILSLALMLGITAFASTDVNAQTKTQTYRQGDLVCTVTTKWNGRRYKQSTRCTPAPRRYRRYENRRWDNRRYNDRYDNRRYRRNRSGIRVVIGY